MGENYSCLEVYSKREIMRNNAHEGALDKTEI